MSAIQFTSLLFCFIALVNGQGVDIQTFTGAVGAPIEPVLFTAGAERPFDIAGDTFVQGAGALGRACDRQFNACANVANGGGGGSVADCSTQQQDCQGSIEASLANAQ